MADKKFEEGHCPSCGSDRADIVAEHKDEFHGGGAGFDFQANTFYRVLECRGCGQHYFKSTSSNSEDYFHYYDPETGEEETEYTETVHYWPPAAKRRSPEWVAEIGFEDRVLGSLFNDVYTALDNNLGVLAAIGMRTVFDRASELLKIDPAKTFQQKLNELKAGDHITEKEKTVLGALIDAGSAAAHRGWQPKPKQLDAMMTILEAFLHRAFLLEDIGAELGKGVPKRQPKGAKKKPA
ncbi:hypothetical protein ROLI_024400 [Roseobacter fucihabitans]|uniref:DUF4145 domain-containing protein n=1 Tax=Roseobacter fucihabitans TaxID=1537242 RepID=A0ABZ2BUE5_9RHOB|nr:DUF4145 domain-containing protein [Roseobacter litoralis]MBC6965254.1 hypothetical protein [Roseobacter litoralis]